ncbi:phospholipase effector Tle1 domain-containing protein [Ralstonia sp. UBA689]|uniref:phospholipase effector Tle1 domain-containing protein n=1 Tax=Ralstonia sp. UBA689 TaxID=1947373 RepID=UPI0025DD308E|nr:DUF2235 domain-containing protein [Ralstonia sp. UBA689]
MNERVKLDPDDATPLDVYTTLMAHSASDYPRGDCLPCGATIRMGFFFDAFGRHRDVDDKTSSQYSNICRLWEAHRTMVDKRRPVNQFWLRFYYSGLGTPLNEDAESNAWINAAVAAAKLGAKQGQKTAKAVGESVGRAKGVPEKLDVAKRVKKAGQDAAKDFSFRPIAQAYQDFRKDIENVPRMARRITNVLGASPERIWERTKAGGVALYRNVKKDIKTNPLKVAQTVARQLFTGIVAENVAIVRDNAVMAEYFGTGVDTRLISAKDQFEEAYKAVKAQMPKVRRIEVSVFGADRGCVLARAFINDLEKKYKRKDDTDLAIEGVEIQIKFLGLLDAVSSIMSEETGNLIGMIPYLGTIKANYKDRQMAVPASVKRCVHFAAAHEMRFYQRLDSLEKTRGEQILYPGTSTDVVGGAPNGSLGFHAELMRMPLRDMLIEAVKAGTAMDTMEDLYVYKNKTFDKFSIAQPITYQGKSYRLKELVDGYRTIVPRASGLDLVAHSKVFLRWIAVRYQDPKFRGSVTDPMADWEQQIKTAEQERRAAKSALDLEMQRQGVSMSMLSSRSPQDQATLLQLKAQSDAAQRRYQALIATAPKQDFSSVWQRLDHEAADMTARWKKMEPEYEAEQREKSVYSFNRKPTYTPIIFAPAHVQHVDLTGEQIELVKAWQAGAEGRNPLSDQVMALFDMLVHDTLLTSWQDHVLAPTLYFRTREKDTFGTTNFGKEDKQRRADDALADRIEKQHKQWQESNGRATTPR